MADTIKDQEIIELDTDFSINEWILYNMNGAYICIQQFDRGPIIQWDKTLHKTKTNFYGISMTS
jgi:hypothetical protein